MSIKTRREQRKKRAEQPLETDWLWSCLPATPLKEIARVLAFTQEPQTELSARFWADERVFKADVYRALFPHVPLKGLSVQEAASDALVELAKSFPHVPLKGLSVQVHWDAFDENLRDACEEGRLLVIRQLPVPMPPAVQMLIDIIGSWRHERGFHFFESHPGARFALVLDGWTQPTIRVRSSYGVKVYRVSSLSSPKTPLA